MAVIKSQHAGASEFLASAKASDHRVEDQRSADLNNIRFCRASGPRADTREWRWFELARDRTDANIVGAIRIEAFAVRQGTHGDDV